MDDEMIPCVPPPCPDEVETFVYTCDGVYERLDVPPGTVLVYRHGDTSAPDDNTLEEIGNAIAAAVGHNQFVIVGVCTGHDLYTISADELRALATIAETAGSDEEE